MAQKQCDLFRWNRKPVKKHEKKHDNVSDWIRSVQDASEQAVQEAYGGDVFTHGESLKEIIPDDEAVYEAQQLLDGWMSKKAFPDLDKELDFRGENWSSTTGVILDAESQLSIYGDSNCGSDNTVLTALRSKYLSEDNDDYHNVDLSPKKYSQDDKYFNFNSVDLPSTKANPLSREFLLKYGNDISAYDDEISDDLLVQDVLDGMLSKDIAKHVDLGMKPLSKSARNPIPKMNARHEQVKTRGEKRRKFNAVKNEQKLSKEEIVQKAKERIVWEEKQRIKTEKVEEAAILTQMENIKLELAEEKQRRKEEEERKQKILEDAKLQMQMELKKQREEEMRRKKEQKVEMHRLQKEVEKQSVDELCRNMKILHRHFSAWYNLVLEKRINMGKVQAISDWKCKLRAWNAWKSYVTHVKSHQEAQVIEQEMKEKYRKNQMAITHSQRTLLRLGFAAWLRYTRHESEKKYLLLEHKEKAKKIALFLEEASKGDLWKKHEDEDMHQNTDQDPDQQACLRHTKNSKVDSNNTAPNKTEIFQCKHDEVECESKTKAKARDLNLKKSKPNVSHSNDSNNNPTKLVKENKVDNIDAKYNKKSANKIDKIISSDGNGNKNIKSSRSLNQLQDFDVSNEIEKKACTARSSSSTVFQRSSSVSKISQVSSQKATTKPLHLAMEERQKQRDERRVLIEKEKGRKNEERLQELKDKEVERLQQEELEKKEKVRKKQEQKKMEVLKQKEKELYTEQFNIKMNMAKEHYHKVLLRKYGLEPLCRLVKVTQLNIKISDKFHNSLLMRLCFEEWKVCTMEITTEKKEKADICYKRFLMRRGLQSLIKYRFHFQNMNKVARRYSSSRIRKRAFNAWQDYVTDERILMWAKESSAEDHDTMRMIKKSFKAWVRFIQLEKEDRLCEQRRNELRKKVQLWLPDYKGETRNLSPS